MSIKKPRSESPPPPPPYRYTPLKSLPPRLPPVDPHIAVPAQPIYVSRQQPPPYPSPPLNAPRPPPPSYESSTLKCTYPSRAAIVEKANKVEKMDTEQRTIREITIITGRLSLENAFQRLREF